MLVGQGANEFAEEMGVPRVSSGSLVTQEARGEFERFLKFKDRPRGPSEPREELRGGCQG